MAPLGHFGHSSVRFGERGSARAVLDDFPVLPSGDGPAGRHSVTRRSLPCVAGNPPNGFKRKGGGVLLDAGHCIRRAGRVNAASTADGPARAAVLTAYVD